MDFNHNFRKFPTSCINRSKFHCTEHRAASYISQNKTKTKKCARTPSASQFKLQESITPWSARIALLVEKKKKTKNSLWRKMSSCAAENETRSRSFFAKYSADEKKQSQLHARRGSYAKRKKAASRLLKTKKKMFNRGKWPIATAICHERMETRVQCAYSLEVGQMKPKNYEACCFLERSGGLFSYFKIRILIQRSLESSSNDFLFLWELGFETRYIQPFYKINDTKKVGNDYSSHEVNEELYKLYPHHFITKFYATRIKFDVQIEK